GDDRVAVGVLAAGGGDVSRTLAVVPPLRGGRRGVAVAKAVAGAHAAGAHVPHSAAAPHAATPAASTAPAAAAPAIGEDRAGRQGERRGGAHQKFAGHGRSSLLRRARNGRGRCVARRPPNTGEGDGVPCTLVEFVVCSERGGLGAAPSNATARRRR